MWRVKSVRFVPTPDDWYPTLPDGLVRGSVFIDTEVSRALYGNYFVRISFWGGDDCGIERDFFFDDVDEALIHYECWLRWLNNIAIVVREDLMSLGFKRG